MDYLKFIASLSLIDRIYSNFSKTSDLLWQISTESISHLDIVDFIIYSFDEKSGELSQEAGFGMKVNKEKQIQDPLNVVLGKGIVGDAAHRMNFQMVSDTSADKRYIVDGYKNSSELAVPIIWQGKLLGVLDSEHPRQNFYKEAHLDLFYTIASFLGPRLSPGFSSRKSITKENKYYLQFIELMENDFLYRDEGLSLNKVAAQFGINKCYLSKIINEASKKRFTEIVNAYRVEDVKASIHSGRHKNFTIMSLAFDAGFASKASFNSIFKKQTGLTPTKYIRQLTTCK